MERATVPLHVVRFGLFELSRDAAELRKGGIRLKLQDQPFQVLCTLLEHPGELITREQLRQQLWPNGTFVDFEHGLNTAIKKLRDVLGDDADVPRYIETVPRKGYRFIAPLDGKERISRRVAQYRPLGSRLRLYLFGGAGLLILIGAIWIWRILSLPQQNVVHSTQLTFSGKVEECCMSEFNRSIQTDGKRIFFSDVHWKLRAVAVSGGEESAIRSELPPIALLHISPDGTTLLARNLVSATGKSEGALWLVPANGGAPKRLGDMEGQDAAFSPDGKTIIVAQGDSLFLTDDRGSNPRKLLTAPGRPFWPRWSPDGKWIRYTVVDSKILKRTLWQASLDGSSFPLLPNWKGDACCGLWTSDGKSYIFLDVRDGESKLWVLPEARLLWRRAQPRLVPFTPVGVRIASITASPQGHWLYVTGQNYLNEVYALDVGTRRTTQLLPGMNPTRVYFSRDGRWITILRRGTLWRSRPDGDELLQLISPPMSVFVSAVYSPDGTRIAFDGKLPDGPYRVYWVSSGGGKLHELTGTVSSQADVNWSSDGQTIIFGELPDYYAESGKPKAIYSYDLKSNEISKLPNSEGWFSPRISPDGRALAALTIDNKRIGLFSFGQHTWRELARRDLLGNLFWSPDGQWIYFNDGVRVWRVAVKSGLIEDVVTMTDVFPAAHCWPYASSPSGHLLFNCSLRRADLYALDWR